MNADWPVVYGKSVLWLFAWLGFSAWGCAFPHPRSPDEVP